MGEQREVGVNVASVFRTVTDLGSCAQVAVALWASTPGSDVQVFMLRQSLQKDLQAVPQWQHLTISLSSFRGITQEAQDITAAEGTHAVYVLALRAIGMTCSFMQHNEVVWLTRSRLLCRESDIS